MDKSLASQRIIDAKDDISYKNKPKIMWYLSFQYPVRRPPGWGNPGPKTLFSLDSNFSDWYFWPLLLWTNCLHRSWQKKFVLCNIERPKKIPCYFVCILLSNHRCFLFFFNLQAWITPSHSYRMAHIHMKEFIMHQVFSSRMWRVKKKRQII